MEYRKCFVKLLLLFACVFADAIEKQSDSTNLRPIPRILNGRVAASGQFPYQISIRISGQHTCGGALVAENFVLTAAHCVYGIPSKYITVNAGTVNRLEDGVVSEVINVTTHPEFGFSNDIAVVELKNPLAYTDLIQAIPIASSEVPANQSVIISGWGRMREGGPLAAKLMYSRSLTVLSAEQCSLHEGYQEDGLLCLDKFGGNGFCNGDDGGPAVYRNFLVGIASFTDYGCGLAKPDRYTKVSAYIEFLNSVMKNKLRRKKH